MQITTENTSIEHDGRAPLKIYAAAPESPGDAPGVVVIHEVWGVDAHIRSVADRLAAAGYRAVAPDLIGMEVTMPREAVMAGFRAISQLAPAERAVPERIAEAMEAVDAEWRDQVRQLMAITSRGATPERLEDVASAVEWLKEHGSKKVAILGFCLGGAYVWAYAYNGGEADAFIPFYGRLPASPDPARVKAPLMGHFGALDKGIPVEPLQQAAAALREHGVDATIHVYEGAPHAFFNETRDAYHPESAALAWTRTLEFLKERVGGG